MKSLRYENGAIDEMDARLLSILAVDGRITNAELARRVGLSAPSVADRIRRLEDASVITGYSAVIDLAALGYEVVVWIRVRPVPGKMIEATKLLKSIAEVTSCDRVTGEDCFIARVCVPSVHDIEQVLDKIAPIAMTHSAIVQSTPVAPRLPPINVTK